MAKQKTESEAEELLGVIYAVADALDIASDVKSPALRARLDDARTYLQASLRSLLNCASQVPEAAAKPDRAGAGGTPKPRRKGGAAPVGDALARSPLPL